MQTVFPYTFKILDASHLEVYEGDTEITTGFTVPGVGSDSGGNVTYTTAPRGSGDAALTVTLKRAVPLSQPDDLPTAGALNTDTLESMIDKSRMIDQQLDEVDQRSIRVPVSSSLTGLEVTPVANGHIAFNADADGLIATTSQIGEAGVSAFMETLIDDLTAAAALTTLGVSAFIQTLLDDADADAARATLGLAVASGSFTYDLSTASGDQAIDGVGFQPTAILLIAVESSVAGQASWGFSVGTNDFSIRDNHAFVADSYNAVSAQIINLGGDGTNRNNAVLTSMDSDGFTLTWTKVASPTGTLTGFYFAIRS